jgi:hypothetical protein
MSKDEPDPWKPIPPPPDHPTGGIHRVYTGTFTHRREDFPPRPSLGKAWGRIARFLDRLDRKIK